MAVGRGSGAADSASAEIGKYLEILAKDPNSRVFAPLAEAYRKAGLLEDAIETALEGLRIHPNYLGGCVALGRALFEKKRYREAADELRKVVRAAPDNIIAHKVLAQIALAQGNPADAEKEFRTVTFLDPHDREAAKALEHIAASAAAPAAAAPAPAPQAASLALESSWLDLSSGASGSSAEIEVRPAPADEAAPPPLPTPEVTQPPALEAIRVEPVSRDVVEHEASLRSPPGELEEPDEEPAGTPAVELHEPEAPALPALEELFDEQPAGAPEAEEPVFEVFTRSPRYEETPSRRPEGGAGRPVFEELELEPAAQLPTDLEEGEPAPVEPPDETPRLAVLDDFALEMESAFAAAAPAVAEPVAPEAVTPEPLTAPPVRAEEEIGWEEEAVWQPPAADEAEAAAPLLVPEEAATEELAWEGPPFTAAALQEETFSLEEESPVVDPTGEIAPESGADDESAIGAAEEAAAEAIEEAAGETFADLDVGEVEAETEPAGAEPPAPAPAAAPVSEGEPGPAGDRGIFDTETLATIYINQGFYGRAAAIYERLVAGSPEDESLRRKLDEVRALERAQSGPADEGSPAGGSAAAAAGSDRAETIRRLEALLEAFRKVRGR